MSGTGLVRRTLKGIAVLAVLGLCGLAALLVSLRLEGRRATTLPTPTGSFAVGRVVYHWRDSAAVDPFAPNPETGRELLVWIWYPSEADPSAAMAEYVPAQMLAATGPPGGPAGLLTRDLSKVQGRSARDAAVSPREASYPVVIMRAGASAKVVWYSTLAEDLASHGYVVVGFDAPYRTQEVVFPDGRVLRRTPENDPELGSPQEQANKIDKLLTGWTADVGFVVDRLESLDTADASGRFAGRLDLSRVGVFGHSLGGATAAQFCHDDSRCKAGIDVDGRPFGSVVKDGLHQPFMLLLSDHGDPSDPVSRGIEADIQSVYDHLPPDGRVRLAIRGANHFFFSDDGALLKSHILVGALRALGLVRIEGPRQLEVTAYCIRTFFDAYLKGPAPSRFEISSPFYPEVQLLP